MTSKKKPKRTSTKKDVHVSHSGTREGRRSWRKSEHVRNAPYDGSVEKSRLTYQKPHVRHKRRKQWEIDAVVEKFLRTGKLPERKIKKKIRGKIKVIDNPFFIADMRILQRRKLIKSKVEPLQQEAEFKKPYKKYKPKIEIPEIKKTRKKSRLEIPAIEEIS